MTENSDEPLDYQFRNRDLLDLALTHSSAAASAGRHNQRLEFLGDAILGLTLSEFLFAKFPAASEGDLSANKAVLAARKTMAEIGRARGWRKFIKVGRGVGDGKDLPDSIYANVGEALIAAVYLDRDYAAARAFILRLFADYLAKVTPSTGARENFKQRLRDWANREKSGEIVYRVLTAVGAAHRKTFRVGAFCGERLLGTGEAANKKSAEQLAAKSALTQVEEI